MTRVWPRSAPGRQALCRGTVEPQTLRATVRSVLEGDELLQAWPDVETVATLDPRVEELIGALTTRELDVFDCLLMGLSTKETGAALEIADQTVKNRVSSILYKLRVTGRMGAIRLALARGWAEHGPDPRVNPAAIAPVPSSVFEPTRRTAVPIPPTMLTSQPEPMIWGATIGRAVGTIVSDARRPR